MWECAEMGRSQWEIVIVVAISTVEKELTYEFVVLCSTSVCLCNVCKTVIHNLYICFQFPYMYPVTYTEQSSQESNSGLIYDPGWGSVIPSGYISKLCVKEIDCCSGLCKPGCALQSGSLPLVHPTLRSQHVAFCMSCSLKIKIINSRVIGKNTNCVRCL